MKLTFALVLGLGLAAVGAMVNAQPSMAPSVAVEPTPQGCQWYARADRQTELFCQDDLGRYRPTGEIRDVSRSTSDGCRTGQLYDGARCVSEAEALDAARHRDGAEALLVARPEPARPAGMTCEPYALVRAGAPGQSGAPVRTGAICQ